MLTPIEAPAVPSDGHHVVHVANVSPDATPDTLREFFAFAGPVASVELSADGDGLQGVVTFENAQGVGTALLLDGVSPNARYDGSTTALMLAAGHGDAESVGLLLEMGADVNATDANGNTALMHAAKQGHADAVELLCALRANVLQVHLWVRAPLRQQVLERGLPSGHWAGSTASAHVTRTWAPACDSGG